MADVDSKPSTAPTTSSSTFNPSAYKESAAFLLTFLVPPAAIAVRQGKVDLEARHLAVSLALYLSVICYLPAVIHAYWLLYVRDNGGVEEWAGARLRQAQGLWNEHGGVVKAKVDEYSPMVIEKYEGVRSYATDKVNYATAKKDEAWSFVTGVISAMRELYEEAREAYAAGTAIDWAKEKTHVVVEKVKTLLQSCPRLQAIVRYVEERVRVVVGTVESPKSTRTTEEYETAEDQDSTMDTVEPPKSTRTTEEYETAEDQDSILDDLFNEGKTEDELSQEL